MSLKTNQLYFTVLPGYDCKLLPIADLSIYADDAEGAVLQIQLPDRENIVETVYTRNSVSVLNSNSLKYTKVPDLGDLLPLPDGWYTIKMSVCPYEQFWFEKDYYRICQLQCKYNQTLLKLDLNKCEKCYGLDYSDKLRQVWFYIQGIVANTENNDVKSASELYKTANNILDNLLFCQDCHKSKNNPSNFSNSNHRKW